MTKPASHSLAAVLFAFLLVAAPWDAPACPMCRDALKATPNAAASVQQKRGYFFSILALVSMPFLVTGTLGWFIVRQSRQSAYTFSRGELATLP